MFNRLLLLARLVQRQQYLLVVVSGGNAGSGTPGTGAICRRLWRGFWWWWIMGNGESADDNAVAYGGAGGSMEMVLLIQPFLRWRRESQAVLPLAAFIQGTVEMDILIILLVSAKFRPSTGASRLVRIMRGKLTSQSHQPKRQAFEPVA